MKAKTEKNQGKNVQFYTGLGLPVFPCSLEPFTKKSGKLAKAKSPLSMHGFLDATTDPAKFETLFYHKTPADYLLGMPNGKITGYIVIDFDLHKNGDPRTFEELKEEIESEHGELPDTFTVRTKNNGIHLYYKYSGERSRFVRFLSLIHI